MGLQRVTPFLSDRDSHYFRIGITKKGLSLLELLITMVLLEILVIISSYTLPSIFKGSRKETQIVHSEIESIIGLEIIRQDVEQAGFGLPFFFKESLNYQEAVEEPQAYFNDSPNSPRPIISGNNISYEGYIFGSDYLVVKSTLCADNKASKAFGYITKDRSGDIQIKTFEDSEEELKDNYRVIILKPKADDKRFKELVTSSGGFFGVYPNLSSFSPSLPNETYIVYGVDPDTDLRMPFNRADFYVRRPEEMPDTCAPNTGILYKAQLRQGDGKSMEWPIVECVADMQVFFGVDQDGDGFVDGYLEDLGSLSSFQIGQMVKEVKIFILTHEAGKDKGYVHGHRIIKVGENNLGRDFDLQERIGEGWQHYRWRLHKIGVRLRNLL